MLKPLTVAKFKFEQWFWTAWSWRSRRYAQIVLQRNTHGERAANVLSCSHFQFDFQFSRAATGKTVEIQKKILSPGCSSNQTTPRGTWLQTPNPNLSLSSVALPLYHTGKCPKCTNPPAVSIQQAIYRLGLINTVYIRPKRCTKVPL